MKTTWIYINSLVRVLCSPLCFEVKHGQLLQYPRHLSEKLSDREPNVWAAAFQIQQVDSPLGMLSRHPLSTLATVSATLPVVLSSRPLGMTVADLSLAWYHIHAVQEMEICSHNFKVFCILSVGICDHCVWKEGELTFAAAAAASQTPSDNQANGIARWGLTLCCQGNGALSRWRK